jgi:TIR domain
MQALSVFISHAGPDKDAIVKLGLIQGLQSRGLRVVVDRPWELEKLPDEVRAKVDGIPLGGPWRPSLALLVERADIVLACWSEEYIKRFDPPRDQPSDGQWARDEISAAFDGGKVVHALLDSAKGFPAPFHMVENDIQFVKFGKLKRAGISIPDAVERLCEFIVKRGQKLRANSLGPEFTERVAALFPILNRELQENPFVTNIENIFQCPVFLVFGSKENLPLILSDRFLFFTLPAHRSFPDQKLSWSEGRLRYFEGIAELTPWRDIAIVNSFEHDQARESVAYIANELASYAPPPQSRPRSISALTAAIEALGIEAKNNHCSFLARISIVSSTWDKKSELIITVLKEVSLAIRSAGADWLRFLVFIERSANQSSSESRRRFWEVVPFRRRSPVEAIPVGRFPPTSAEPEFWRLPNLSGVRPVDCEKWVEGVARAWSCDVQLAKGWIRDAIGIEDEKTFERIKAILTEDSDVLARIWLKSRRHPAPGLLEGA